MDPTTPPATELINLHLEQWRKNRAFAQLVPQPHYEWAVTILFYAAIHIIDAALAAENRYPCDHDQRKLMLSGINRFSLIRKKFWSIYELARKVRYVPYPSDWISIDEVKKHLLGQVYYPIENSALKLLQHEQEPRSPIVFLWERLPSISSDTPSKPPDM